MIKKIILSLGLVLMLLTVPSIVYGYTDDVSQQNYDEAGTYPVEVKAIDKNGVVVNKTIYVTVLFEKTVVNKEVYEAIDAHDVLIEAGDFDQLSDADLIRITNAHAWHTDDGSEVPITAVLRHTLNAAAGEHQVTFATELGSSITVYVYETNKQILPVSTTYINPQDFSFTNNFLMIVFFVILLIILPVGLLIAQYLIIRREEKKVEALLYRDK